jgi:hypothetical protein
MERIVTIVVCGAMALGMGGCADKRSASPQQERQAQAAEPKYAPAPASSPMAKVQPGMTEPQVAAILGVPDDSKAYVTGKAFIPFYYGPDQSRFACYYKGKGRVIFEGGNQWGAGRGKVVRVEYDPSEDGLAATK